MLDLLVRKVAGQVPMEYRITMEANFAGEILRRTDWTSKQKLDAISETIALDSFSEGSDSGEDNS